MKSLVHGALAALTLIAAPTSAGAAESCAQLNGDDVLKAASDNGFSPQVLLGNAISGVCRPGLRPSVFSLVAGPAANSCEISLMAGRLLAPGWSITNYVIDGAHGRMAADDNGKGLIRFRLNVSASRQVAVRVTTIDLAGPDCDKWKDAFRLSREVPPPPRPPTENPEPNPELGPDEFDESSLSGGSIADGTT